MFNSDPKFRKVVLNLARADLEAIGGSCGFPVKRIEQELESLISGNSQDMQSLLKF